MPQKSINGSIVGCGIGGGDGCVDGGGGLGDASGGDASGGVVVK